MVDSNATQTNDKTHFRLAKIFDFGSFEDFIVREFYNGISVKMADIISGKYFLYLQSPHNALFPCVVYNSLLPTSSHNARKKPIIHFMQCDFLGDILAVDSTKAKIMDNNAFDYVVGNNARFSTKIFYDVKLPFCAKCVESYEKIFGTFEDDNIWAKMFQNELFSAIELESLKLEAFDIFKTNKYFFMTYKRG